MEDETRARARSIKMILMDVDGTLTDGTLTLLPDGSLVVSLTWEQRLVRVPVEP